MSRERLTYLSTKTLDELYAGILENTERYLSSGFDDLVELGGWDIHLSIEIDLDPLQDLDPSGGPEAETENSLLVWRSLHELTPALACEDRIWTRLSHVECREYSRDRWVKQGDKQSTAKAIRDHFFAPSMTACRDDHAISRLWWNAHIAKVVRPHDQRTALELMLKTADIRSNFIERTMTVGRPRVASSILRIMEREDWVTEKEANYREFMKSVNHRGGGIVFEMLPDSQLDDFMNECFLAVSG